MLLFVNTDENAQCFFVFVFFTHKQMPRALTKGSDTERPPRPQRKMSGSLVRTSPVDSCDSTVKRSVVWLDRLSPRSHVPDFVKMRRGVGVGGNHIITSIENDLIKDNIIDVELSTMLYIHIIQTHRQVMLLVKNIDILNYRECVFSSAVSTLFNI